MKYHELRPFAFRLSPSHQAIPYDCVTVSFPQPWRQCLQSLQARHSNRPPDQVKVPIASLNNVIRALVPDVLSIGRDALSVGKTWLYCSAQVDSAALISLIHSWVRTTFTHVSQAELDAELRKIRVADLQPLWKAETLNLAAWQTNAAGTAQPVHDDAYAFLPAYIAALISGSGQGLEYGSQILSFRRASLAPGQQGMELVSWPPLKYTTSFGTEYPYSVVLTFTVQTVPFQSYPVIHCDASLRRWVSSLPLRAPEGRTNVYLLTNVPWLPSLTGLTTSFQVAALKHRLSSNNGWENVWADNLIEILSDQRAAQMPINVEELVKQPHLLLQDQPPVAAITYHTRMQQKHRVGAGVTIKERAQLMRQLLDRLAPMFELTQPLPRIQRKPSKISKSPFLSKIQEPTSLAGEQVTAKRRSLIADAVGKQLAIEIHTDDPAVQTSLINAVRTMFGIPAHLNAPLRWETPELTLDLSLHSSQGFHAPLELTTGRRRRDKVSDAMQRRTLKVRSQLGLPAQTPTLAFAEIWPKNDYTQSTDPKTALRIGFGRSNRLVQFITLPSSTERGEDEDTEQAASLPHRARSSLLDGLRQLGVRRSLPIQQSLDGPLNLVGVWMINKTGGKPGRDRYLLPVLVHMSTADPIIRAIAPGMDEWLPYREALIALAHDQVNSYKRKQDVKPDFIRSTLKSLLQHDTLVFCHAQNLRWVWKWLRNTEIQQDAMWFTEDQAEEMTQWSKLRVVRIRDSQRHETPEWFAENGRERSAAQGLFAIGPRVFASTHPKPTPFLNYKHSFSKEDLPPTNSSKKHKANITINTWNPGLFELTVAVLQSEDAGNALRWASITHELRKMAAHYDDATALPLPLHLAKRMEEYICSLELADEEDS